MSTQKISSFLSRPFLWALIFCGFTVALAVPHHATAAALCPSNMEQVSQYFGLGKDACSLNGQIVGLALDPDSYSSNPCSSGGMPFRRTQSEDANGSVFTDECVDPTTGTPIAAMSADDAATGSTQNTKPGATCNWATGFSFNKCIWQPFMSWTGSWFLTMGGGILLVAGTVFDWFVKLLVVEFAKTLQDLQILDGLKKAWALFRDISNIAIIGIFVFVAIMTILGSAEYGAKRLVARVLIVAILINFSFLFSQIIVEGANFISAQFWKGMPASVQSQGTAQSFLKTFGMENVWTESRKLTDQAAKQSDSGWAAFFYGLIAGSALLGVAIVLLYGVFVISARALLMIFAMLTSAIAFASFLLPNTSQQAYIGWSAWWSNLIKAALFGPLLMIFLWITMTILGNVQLQAKGAGNAVGALAHDPSQMKDPAAWGSIVLLMIATGMLFIAIRAAGSFASGIGGFNLAGGLPLAISSRLAGVIGRNTLGWGATAMGYRNEKWLSQARMERDRVRASFDRGEASAAQVARAERAVRNLVKDSAVYDKISKSTFNAANTRLGKDLVKSLGVSGIAGKGESYGAYADRKAKEAAKKAEKETSTGDEKKSTIADEQKAMGVLRDTAQKTLESARASGEHQGLATSRAEAQKEIERIRSVATEDIKNLGRAGASQTEIQKRIAERDSALKEQANKISTAHKAITELEENALRKAGMKNPQEARRVAGLSNDQIVKDAKERVNRVADDAAREAAARYAAGTFGSTDSIFANKARDLVKKSKKDKDEGHHILEAIKKQMEHGHEEGGGKDAGGDHT